eukprot:6174243-Pleurochrysis_carterae.AAC.4
MHMREKQKSTPPRILRPRHVPNPMFNALTSACAASTGRGRHARTWHSQMSSASSKRAGSRSLSQRAFGSIHSAESVATGASPVLCRCPLSVFEPRPPVASPPLFTARSTSPFTASAVSPAPAAAIFAACSALRASIHKSAGRSGVPSRLHATTVQLVVARQSAPTADRSHFASASA